MSAERRRLTLAFLLSLLFHGLLLSMTFGGQGLGLPGFGFPWGERRAEAPDLRVLLVPAPVTAAEPAATSVNGPPAVSIRRTVAGPTAPIPSASPAPTPGRAARAIPSKAKVKAIAPAEPAQDVPTAAVAAETPLPAEGSGDAVPTPIPGPAVIAMERSDEPAWVVPPRPPEPASGIADAPNASRQETVTPVPRDAGEVAQERAEPEVRERAVEVARPDPAKREAQREADQLAAARIEAAQLEEQRQEAARQAAARAEAARLEAQRREAAHQEAARVEAARLAAQRQEAARQDEAARLERQRHEAARQEAARAEAARLEAQRQEAARIEATRAEARRQEAARVEAARLAAERQEAARQAAARQAAAQQEAARQEAARQESARQEAAQQEAARQEAARQEAARAEAAGVEAERQEAMRQVAAKQEAQRQEVARQEAARVQAEKEEDARREARRRAMGRELEEAAARRQAQAAANAARPPSTLPLSLSTARRVRLWGRSDPNGELVQYAEAWARKIQFNTPVDTVREVANRPHTQPMVTVAIRSDGSVESVTFVLSSGVAEVDEAIRRIVQSHAPYQAFQPGLAREFDVVEVRRTWHFDMAIRLY